MEIERRQNLGRLLTFPPVEKVQNCRFGNGLNGMHGIDDEIDVLFLPSLRIFVSPSAMDVRYHDSPSIVAAQVLRHFRLPAK